MSPRIYGQPAHAASTAAAVDTSDWWQAREQRAFKSVAVRFEIGLDELGIAKTMVSGHCKVPARASAHAVERGSEIGRAHV